MPVRVLAAVHIPSYTGLPKDDVVNTFMFKDALNNTDVDRDAVFTAITAAYNTTQSPNTSPMAAIFGQDRQRNACTVVMYNADAAVAGTGGLGAPIDTRTWTLSGTNLSADSLPLEVAICLSFHGDYGILSEDTPAGPAGPVGDVHGRARVRGRVYLGPLCRGTMATDSDPHVGATAMALVAGAGDRLLLGAGTRAEWHVWSRAAHQTVPVVGGWVDNEFDTQRRRQHKASSRLLWPPAV